MNDSVYVLVMDQQERAVRYEVEGDETILHRAELEGEDHELRIIHTRFQAIWVIKIQGMFIHYHVYVSRLIFPSLHSIQVTTERPLASQRR
jgi:hypothetical protein